METTFITENGLKAKLVKQVFVTITVAFVFDLLLMLVFERYLNMYATMTVFILFVALLVMLGIYQAWQALVRWADESIPVIEDPSKFRPMHGHDWPDDKIAQLKIGVDYLLIVDPNDIDYYKSFYNDEVVIRNGKALVPADYVAETEERFNNIQSW